METTLRDTLQGLPGHSTESRNSTPPSSRNRGNSRLLRQLQPDYREGDDVQALQEYRCVTCRDGGRVRRVADLADPDFGKSFPCPDCQGPGTSHAVFEVEFLRRSRIPMRYVSKSLGNHEPANFPTVVAVRRWCSEWPPAHAFLVLTGNAGTGKTHLACGALRDVWQRRGVIGQFWGVPSLLARYRAAFDDSAATETEAAIDQMMARAPLLVLDDVGKERGTPWASEKLYWLVNHRYSDELPTIITTNVALKADPTTERLLDRESSLVVAFTGPSYRTAVPA